MACEDETQGELLGDADEEVVVVLALPSFMK